jgi:hypothetical protein
MSTQSAKKAKLEKPANYYKSPDDITKDADLSPDEKRQALNTWEQDARQMLTASNEGMEGDEEGLDQRFGQEVFIDQNDFLFDPAPGGLQNLGVTCRGGAASRPLRSC